MWGSVRWSDVDNPGDTKKFFHSYTPEDDSQMETNRLVALHAPTSSCFNIEKSDKYNERTR